MKGRAKRGLDQRTFDPNGCRSFAVRQLFPHYPYKREQRRPFAIRRKKTGKLGLGHVLGAVELAKRKPRPPRPRNPVLAEISVGRDGLCLARWPTVGTPVLPPLRKPQPLASTITLPDARSLGPLRLTTQIRRSLSLRRHFISGIMLKVNDDVAAIGIAGDRSGWSDAVRR